MYLEINCQNSPNLQSGYFARTPAPRRAFLALQDRIIPFTWLTAVSAKINLHLKMIGGYICSVAAKSATGFGSPIHRRMFRLFTNWRFFCAQNFWKQNVHHLTLPNEFLARLVGSLVLAGPMTGLPTHSMRLFCLEAKKVNRTFFIGAMS